MQSVFGLLRSVLYHTYMHIKLDFLFKITGCCWFKAYVCVNMCLYNFKYVFVYVITYKIGVGLNL